MHVLRLLGSGVSARPDRPDRLVSNDGFLHLLGGQTGQTAAHLCSHHQFRPARFSLGKCFAHAHDWLERGRVRGQRPLRDEFVCFLLVLAPFRVAQNHVTDGKLLEHPGGDFACVGAKIVLAHVLRSQSDIRIEDRPRDVAQRGKRWTDDDVHFLDVSQLPLQTLHQVQRLGNRLVHFPVAGDDQFARFVHGSRFQGQ